MAAAITLAMVASLTSPVGQVAGAAPAAGEIPQQEWGTAAGRSHEVPARTPATGQNTGEPVAAPAPGALPPDVPFPDPVLAEPTPAPATDVRVGEGTAQPVATAQGDRRELVNRRTRDAQVFRNPDGTETLRVFQGRKFFSRNGLWFPVDSSLTRDGASWRTKADSVHKRFAERADAPEVVSLELGPGVSVGYGVQDVEGATARVDGSIATYDDIRPGVDLEVEATAGGIKENLVLASADAPTEWSFPLRLDGVTASLDNGAVQLKDASGVVRAVIPPGFMEDSAVDPRSGEGVRSWGVTYRLDGDVLRVGLDRSWLADPARVFPVKVDPSVVDRSTDGTTFVQAPYHNDYSGDPNFSVGTFDGGTNKANAFLKFDSVSWALAGQYVLGANLYLYNTYSYSCEARTVWVHEVTQPWSVSGNKSWPGPSFGGALSSKSFASGRTGCDPGGKWQKIELGDYGRAVVHGWTHGAANHGLTVRASDADNYGWKKFAGRNSGNPPYLEVTYNPYWATYQVGSMTTPVMFDRDGKMQVTVTNHGRDTWTPGSNHKLSYRLWNSAGTELGTVSQTSMPHDVRPGESAAVLATIGRLNPGTYTLRFDMDHYGTTKYSSTGVPMSQEVKFTISNTIPVLTGMSPPSNYVTEVLTPTLALTGRDPDNHPGHGLAHLFKICDAGGDNLQNCTESTWDPSPTWRVPEGKLTWGKSYAWYGSVGDWGSNSPWSQPSFLTAQAPQPAITSHLGASSASPGGAVDPGVGNYTTTATDAAVPAVGPPLSVVRSYNSLDPRRGSAFGAGWSTRWDTAITPDTDGSGNLVVTYPEGYQVRFGKRPDGTYAPPAGRFATLVAVPGGGWKLTTKGHVNYAFDAGGKLTSISDDSGRNQALTYETGRLATATDTVSGRSLAFTWTGGHVTRVTTGPDPALSWDYTYTGDQLTKVCDPSGACTTYDYSDMVHYRSTVLDGNPSGYWRLYEASGTVADNRAPIGGPQANGTYTNVTLGAPGAIPGSGITSGSFNGTSYLKLPNNAIGTKAALTAELWFKTGSTAGGVLLGTSSTAQPPATPSGPSMPILYVGTDGKLHGHFWNSNVTGIVTPTAVNDDKWHHVVLSANVDRQTLYLDGSVVGTQTGQITQSNPLTWVGAGPVNNAAWPARPADDWGRFTGQISEVAIYDRPLSTATVVEHWNARALTKVLAKVTLPGGRVAARIGYNRAGDRVATHTDHNGGVWNVASLALSSKTSASVAVANPDDQTTTHYYDPSRNGRLTSTKNPLGHTVEYSYDTGGFVSAVTGEDGVDIRYANDARGNVLTKTLCDISTCSPGSTMTRTSYYDYYLNTADPLDPRNDRVTEERDARSANRDDDTYLKTFSYTASGELAGTTLPGGGDTDRRSTSRAYTTGAEPAVDGGTMPAGLLLTETDAGGGVTRHAYDGKGDRRESTDPAGLRTTRRYDGLGRMTGSTVHSATVPGGAATSYTYDSLSRPLVRTEPRTTNAVTGTPHQRRTTNTYNPDGTLASVKVDDATLNDPGRTTSHTYDAFGRVATTTDPANAVTTTEHDGFGQPTRKVDAAGNEFTYTYTTGRHQLATTTVKGFTGDGGAARDIVVQSLAYDPKGRVVERTDAMGRTTAYTYEAYGIDTETLLGYRDPETGVVSDIPLVDRTYDEAGNLIRYYRRDAAYYTGYSIDRAGRVGNRYDIDWACRRCDQEPANTYRFQYYRYDANDNVTSTWVTDIDDAQVFEKTDFTHDPVGRELTRAVHTGSGTLVTTTTRDELGLPLTVTDPRGTGHTTTFGYDAAGRQVTRSGPAVQVESAGQAPTTASPVDKTGYNTFGEVVDQLDPLGNVTRTAYDGVGRPLGVTLPDYTPPGSDQPISATTGITYDGLGRITSTTDALGARTDFEYDQLGNQVRRTDPLLPGRSQRGVWTNTHDPVGELLSTTDPNGAQTSATYDKLGNKITSTVVERHPGPTRNLTTRLIPDLFGRVAAVITPDNRRTDLEYNDRDDLTWTSDAFGNQTSSDHDLAGRLVSTTDATGAKSVATYDQAGRMTSTSDLDPAGAVLRSRSFGYDAAGNRTSATDSLGKTTTWTYDAQDRLRSVTRPGGITTGYGYDVAGNLTRVTDGNGNTTTYTVNTWGLPESTIEPATAQSPNAADRRFTQSYDAAGRPAVLGKPGGVSITTSYDPLGNPTGQTGAGASVATSDRVFGYDLTGRMTSASTPTGTNTYTYDDRGNLVNATGPSGASSFTYDNDNNLATTSTAAGTTTYGYDAAGRFTSARDPITGATATYSLDELGRTTTIGYGANASTRAFTYDPLGRLATDTTAAPGGASTASTTYTFDTEDRLTGKTTTGLAGAGANTYGYDDAGRLTRWTTGSTTTEYGWDGAGNLTRDGPATATYDERNQLLTRGDTTYGYTARGTLASRTTAGTTTTPAFNAYDELVTDGGTTNTYDAFGRLIGTGNQNLAYQGVGQAITSAGTELYSHTPDGTPLGVKQGTTTAVAVTDQHTDLVGVVDPASGAVTGSRTYSPFGAVKASSGTRPGLGFQHQWTDPTSGNVNMGARWYQPGTGTFASRDTAALDPTDLSTANRHAYTPANPLGYTDPTGNTPACLAGLAGGPVSPFLVGGCFLAAGAILATAHYLATHPPSVAMPDVSVPDISFGNRTTTGTTTTGTTTAPRPQRNDWGTGRGPDGGKVRFRIPDPSNGKSSNSPKQQGQQNSNYGHWNADSGGIDGGGYWGGDQYGDPTGSQSQQAAQAAQVLLNALTPAARPELQQSVAPSVQAMIDAANSLPTIDLGVLNAGGAAGGEAFQPDQAGAGSTIGGLPTQLHYTNNCMVGGFAQVGVFGGIVRGAQVWERDDCGEDDDIEQFIRNANAPEKNKWTGSGRALSKKLGRAGERGNWMKHRPLKTDEKGYNSAGANFLGKLFAHPGARRTIEWGQGKDAVAKGLIAWRLPDGRGARWELDGTFVGFV
ncbi:LamG-like jellyroll fold domain-containing protein [Saccharothrix sp. Mg75]|uniref:LamG-like jellyroll fold domain-containing protein n=1 Tax=Saccharothrix sp. Mg75 TaxID=3445357 RepID=UPI003EED99E9